MSNATLASRVTCRTVAVLLGVCGLACTALGVVMLPPVLEAHVLVDGRVGSALVTVGVWGFGLGTIVAGFVVDVAALRLFQRAKGVPARSVQLVAMAVVFVAVIVGVLAEVTTRLLVPPSAYLVGDAYWIHRWVEQRAAQPATHADGAGFKADYPMDRFDPELGWVPSEGYRSEEINVSSQGARGVAEYALPRPADRRRIVIVGDSFTFGEGVADADTYPAQLAGMFEGVEVVNLGVLGYGTDQQLLRLERSAFGFEPDLVVLGFFGPNADRNVLGFRDAPKPRFELAGDGLRLANTPLPGLDTQWESPLPWLRGPALIGGFVHRALDRTVYAPKWEVTRRLLDAIARACRERGVPLMLAFFPEKDISFMDEPADVEIVVEAWARERGVHFFSVRPGFSKLAQPERARVYYGHWTPYGNGLVASLLADEIRASGYVTDAP